MSSFDPELPLLRSPLRPEAFLRTDQAWLDEAWRSAGARVAVFRSDKVGLADESDVTTAWRAPDGLRERAQVWVFLGLDEDDRPHFAVALPESAVDACATWRSLRDLAVTGQIGELAMLAPGLALLNWHSTHSHCPQCGTSTTPGDAGWIRICANDDSQHFPRVDPAVIMLALDSQDRALLGRQRSWPRGWYSTLAGFVEPGESIEAAVAREVAEEVGLKMLSAQYLGSQPWPFPSSLMLGFHARVANGEPEPDGVEIAEAVWVTRTEISDQCLSGQIRLPPRLSISRWLIERWFGAELPGGWVRT